MHVRPNPAVGFQHLNREVYDPIWQAASEVGLPIGFHPLSSADLPGATQGLRIDRLGTSEIPVQDQADYGADNIFFAQAIGNPVDMMTTITMMTAGGVSANSNKSFWRGYANNWPRGVFPQPEIWFKDSVRLL